MTNFNVPNIYNISAGENFLESLAEGVISRYGGDPLTLSRVMILLPNRRSARALEVAFLKQSKTPAMLLPQIRGIGDTDEEELHAIAEIDVSIPPAIPETERRLLLMQMIRRGRQISGHHALKLAIELGRLMDDIEREQLSISALQSLVPEELAKHWQITLDFLESLLKEWPEKLKSLGYSDRWVRKNVLMQKQIELWKTHPPKHPIIAAGSTGTVPSTKALLKAIAKLPNGAVILPDLDRTMDETSWDQMEEDHPQYNLKMLIKHIGVDRFKVPAWGQEKISSRTKLISELMRPISTIDAWKHVASIPADAIQDFKVIEAETLEEESHIIAVKMREVLEHPSKTVCLVTQHRELARRVGILMQRWNVVLDDSAGKPITELPAMIFLQLVGEMIASRYAPTAMLAALKHPFAAGREDPALFRKNVRLLEKAVLRGVRLSGGLPAIHAMLTEQKKSKLAEWIKNLETLCAPLEACFAAHEISFKQLFETHMDVAEALATSDLEAGYARLWGSEEGGAAAKFMSEILITPATSNVITPESYLECLHHLCAGNVYRPAYGQHDRASILSPMEARLLSADVMILGGMNQDSWPKIDSTHWMSRPMADAFGLPSEARKIGISAHDFASFCHAPELMITRAKKIAGVPTMPSMWLLRLEVILEKMGVLQKIYALSPWNTWAAECFTPEVSDSSIITPPAPKPPMDTRPLSLSVTQIETLMRNPYALYVRKILALEPLKPIDQDPDAANFGSMIHDVIERFLERYDATAKPDFLHRAFIQCGEEVFQTFVSRPAIYKIWWPRFLSIAEWFVPHEMERQKNITKIASEIWGETVIKTLSGKSITLKAKADRIELDNTGAAHIIDYKTGILPSFGDILNGYSPQLTVEAMMLLDGAFSLFDKVQEVASLEYWKVGSGRQLGDKKVFQYDNENTRKGLVDLLHAFYDLGIAYHSSPNADKTKDDSQLEKLSRQKEWQT